jgi:predicted lipoprotein with Yx(FWY)xxD motif
MHVTKLRLLLAVALMGALALTATAEASASTSATGAGHAVTAGPRAVHAKKKKKHKKKAKAAAILKVGTIPAGSVLIGGVNGHTVYMRSTETTTTSSCTGACATIWPAVVATGKPVAGPGLDKSKLTVAMQASGQNQVVYNGHLLYFFANDLAPGDAKGLGLPSWHAVSPTGDPVGGV